MTREQAEAHLKALVGRDDVTLYDDQWAAIEVLAVHRRRALVVQRTGWGKSAVYFVATALLREAGSGPTIIVSPLLALMRNQIAAAERAGIRAVTINSTNPEEWAPIRDRISAGEVDVLLVSPERLNNPGFRDQVLPDLTATAGLLVIDEAHCISDWGHDFRPDYRRIRQMIADLPEGIPVLATTATANERVTADVAEQLTPPVVEVRAPATSPVVEVRAPVSSPVVEVRAPATSPVVEVRAPASLETLVLRGSLDRESLRLAVLNLPRPEQRLAWLADHLDDLEGSGIIYCLTVAATQEVAEFLRSRGHNVAAYSGQTEQTERLALEDDLANGRVKALVATSALGMGFDATLGFVVNVGAPASPVAYYQQVGRAGRGTDRADVILLPAREDRDIWRYFASLSFPPEQHVRMALKVLGESDGPMSTPALETWVDLSRGRLEMMLKVLDVDGAVRRVRGGWEATGRDWGYDEERYARVAEARRREQDAMLGYLDTDRCRMAYLREQLDDLDDRDRDWRCGRCDNCGGFTVPISVSEQASEQAMASLQRPGVVLGPRKMWPQSLANLGIDLRGRIPADQVAEPGRVVARLTDLGLGGAARALFAPGSPDQEVPVPLVHGVLAVLDDWGIAVDGIVAFESLTRPTLVGSLADGLSRRLGVPVLGRVAIADSSVEPGRGAANSAQRVAAVIRRHALRLDLPVDGARLLLVDDQVVSGWSVTLASAWLREQGADAVLPLALASQS